MTALFIYLFFFYCDLVLNDDGDDSGDYNHDDDADDESKILLIFTLFLPIVMIHFLYQQSKATSNTTYKVIVFLLLTYKNSWILALQNQNKNIFL